MGRAKIARKSTSIDMTAMCDVAFLLLSFFILATKTKPPEAVSVVTPTSVQKRKVPEKGIYLVTMSKDNKVYISLPEDAKKDSTIMYLNQYNPELQLSPTEISALASVPFIGVPLNQLKALAANPTMDAALMPGIPVADSAKNDLKRWMQAVALVNYNVPQLELMKRLIVKGDGETKYGTYKGVKAAFKSVDFLQFSIVTNPEGVEPGTELYKDQSSIEVKEQVIEEKKS